MISIKQLQRAVSVLQLKILSEKAEVNYQVLRRKILNGKELDLTESRKVGEALKIYGIKLDD